jgi:hypothetical protein
MTTELTPDAQAILDAGRDLDGAGDLEKARVRRALFAKIVAGGAVLGAASTAAADGGAAATTTTGSVAASGGATATGTFATLATPLAKILIPLAVIVGGGAGGLVAWRAQRALGPAPAPAPVTAPSVTPAPAPAAPALAPVIEPAPTRAPAARATPAHHAHAAAPARAEPAAAPATNRLAEEMALLAAANAELRRGDARRALSLLDDYDRRYPEGVLREEVLATRVIARCQLGGAPDKAARHGAAAFLARHPASPLAPRVRSSCGSE